MAAPTAVTPQIPSAEELARKLTEIATWNNPERIDSAVEELTSAITGELERGNVQLAKALATPPTMAALCQVKQVLVHLVMENKYKDPMQGALYVCVNIAHSLAMSSSGARQLLKGKQIEQDFDIVLNSRIHGDIRQLCAADLARVQTSGGIAIATRHLKHLSSNVEHLLTNAGMYPLQNYLVWLLRLGSVTSNDCSSAIKATKLCISILILKRSCTMPRSLSTHASPLPPNCYPTPPAQRAHHVLYCSQFLEHRYGKLEMDSADARTEQGFSPRVMLNQFNRNAHPPHPPTAKLTIHRILSYCDQY